MDKIEFSNNIRTYRRLHEMSQVELGERLGMDRSYIRRIEKGEYNPRVTTLFKLAKIFNIPMNEVFFPKDEVPQIRINSIVK